MTTLPLRFKFIPKSFLVIGTIVLKSLFLESCIGGDEKVGPIYDIDSISKAYCIFTDSSLWVYELEGASFVDSILLVKSEFTTTDPNNEFSSDGYISWFYRLESMNLIGSSLTGSGFIMPAVGTENPEISQMIYRNGGIPQITIFFGSDSVEADPPQSAKGSKIRLIETMDSMMIGDSTFHDILVFENTKIVWSNVPTIIYWAKGVGRVRVENINGEVWNLIDYDLK